jgi:hypothetical protein
MPYFAQVAVDPVDQRAPAVAHLPRDRPGADWVPVVERLEAGAAIAVTQHAQVHVGGTLNATAGELPLLFRAPTFSEALRPDGVL